MSIVKRVSSIKQMYFPIMAFFHGASLNIESRSPVSVAHCLYDYHLNDSTFLIFHIPICKMGRLPPAMIVDLPPLEDRGCLNPGWVLGGEAASAFISWWGCRIRKQMTAEGFHGPLPVPGHLFLVSNETSRNFSHLRRMCLETFRIKGEGSNGHDCYERNSLTLIVFSKHKTGEITNKTGTLP